MGRKKLSKDFFYIGETGTWIVYVQKKTNEVFRAPVKFKKTMEVAGKSSLYAAIGILLMNIFGISLTGFLSTQELNFAHKNIIFAISYYMLIVLNTILFWKINIFNKYEKITKISKAEKRDFISAVNKNIFIKFDFNTPYIKAFIFILVEDLIFIFAMLIVLYAPFEIWSGTVKLTIKDLVEILFMSWGFAGLVSLVFEDNVFRALKYVKYFNEGKLHFIDD